MEQKYDRRNEKEQTKKRTDKQNETDYALFASNSSNNECI